MNYHFEDRVVNSIGRNGNIKTIGIDVFQTKGPLGKITISPINSRGNTSHCEICLPNKKEDIRSLIDMLKVAYDSAES